MSTERPHSTGVESINTIESQNPGQSWANTAISQSMSSLQRARRFHYSASIVAPLGRR